MHPNGANKNIVDHAIFSKEGPYLNRPADTRMPSVIPNKYRLKNKKNKNIPKSKIEIPNNGDVSKIAGTKPISDLIYAVRTSEVKISPILIGAMKRLVKLLLHISSKKSMLKPILVLNKKS